MPSKRVALRQLDKLAGGWRTRGVMRAGPDKGKSFSGADRYMWLPGGNFLQHTWNVRMPDGLHRGVEILGFDSDSKTIFAHAYDADGSLTVSQIAFRGSTIRILGARLSFRGRFDGTGTAVTGTWSTTDDAEPAMDVNLTSVGRKA